VLLFCCRCLWKPLRNGHAAACFAATPAAVMSRTTVVQPVEKGCPSATLRCGAVDGNMRHPAVSLAPGPGPATTNSSSRIHSILAVAFEGATALVAIAAKFWRNSRKSRARIPRVKRTWIKSHVACGYECKQSGGELLVVQDWRKMFSLRLYAGSVVEWLQ
jgi:hypothetical protein